MATIPFFVEKNIFWNLFMIVNGGYDIQNLIMLDNVIMILQLYDLMLLSLNIFLVSCTWNGQCITFL
jgi:hypothetical protein